MRKGNGKSEEANIGIQNEDLSASFLPEIAEKKRVLRARLGPLILARRRTSTS